ADALADAERGEHRDYADEAREDQQHGARPVHAEVVHGADRRQPRHLLLVLDVGQERLELVVGDEQNEHQAEVREEGDLLDDRVVAAARVGHQGDAEGHDDRDPDADAEEIGRLEDPGARYGLWRGRGGRDDGREPGQDHRKTPGDSSPMSRARRAAITISAGVAGVRAAAAARRPDRSDIRPSALSPAGSQRSVCSTIPAEGSNMNLSSSDEVTPVTLPVAAASQPEAVSAPSLL